MSRIPDSQPPSLDSNSQLSNSQLSDPLGASQVPDLCDDMRQPGDREPGRESMRGAECQPEVVLESQFPLVQPDPHQGSYEEPGVGSNDESL